MEIVLYRFAFAVYAVIQIVCVHPSCVGSRFREGDLSVAHSRPMRIGFVRHIEIAKPPNHDIYRRAPEIVFQLGYQAFEAFLVDIAMLFPGISFSLHPKEIDRLDSPAIDGGIDFLHELIVEIARRFWFAALSRFPVLVPSPYRLPTLSVFHDDGVFSPVPFMDFRYEGKLWVQSGHVGLARKDEKVGAFRTASGDHNC